MKLVVKRACAVVLAMVLVLTQFVPGVGMKKVYAKSPTAKIVESEGYTIEEQADGSVNISYSATRDWNTVNVEINDLDCTAYDRMKIVIVPSRAGMNLGIMDDTSSIYFRNHWGEGCFNTAEEQELVFELTSDISGLKMYCDVGSGFTEPTKDQTFVIRSISFFHSLDETKEDVCVSMDGENRDWDHIKKMVTDTGLFAYAAAFKTDKNLYVMRELTDVSNFANDYFVFDVDGDHTNGYVNAGIDYMLQGSTMYKYTGIAGNWGWTSVTTNFVVKTSEGKAIAEYCFPLKDFENVGDEICINIGCVNAKWGFIASYPAASTTLEKVPNYEEVYIDSDAEHISNFGFTTSTPILKALSKETLAGGVVGTFSAEGGNGIYKYTFASSDNYGADNNKFRIDQDKLVVKDKLLSPGNYSVYIQVTSDIRTYKQAFEFVVEKAPQDNAITEELFSGQAGEWFAVNHDAANDTANLSTLKAVSDGKYLYAYVSTQALSDNTVFYVNTENGSGNDMTDKWSDATNVTYQITIQGSVLAYEDGTWNDTGKKASIYKNNSDLEMKVALDDLSGASGNIGVAVTEGNNSMLPNADEDLLWVSTPIMTKAPSITADGDDSDWEKVAKLAKGLGTVGDLYAIRTNDYLYVMTHISDVDMSKSYALSTNLLIDADANASTGYQNPSYSERSGAEFLVQDWFSNDVGSDIRNVEFFSYDNGWKAESGNTNYKVYKEDGDTYCIEYAIPMADLKAAGYALSDDFYVAIDRTNPDLQAGTGTGCAPAEKSFVKVPKYGATVSVSVDDRSFRDWKKISNSVGNTSTSATYNLYATCSQERLYTLVTSEHGGLNTANQYMISVDDNTGYRFGNLENTDYVIRDAYLYKVVADQTLSDQISPVWMSYYDDSVEMQLYTSELGKISNLKIAYIGKSGDIVLPSSGQYMEVDATFEIARDEDYYYPQENFASVSNPYKGWVGWSSKYKEDADDLIYYDYDIVYVPVLWKDFEPEKGVYDFKAIEEKYNLKYWLSEGKRINLRFIMDNVSGSTNPGEESMDIPQWLYEELIEENGVKGAGVFYNTSDIIDQLGGSGFSPNYDSEILLKYHEKAIEALAGYFDDTSKVSFVQIGSLGHWGEFHTWPEGSGNFPKPSVAAKYMEHYVKYFKNVKLGLRKPYPYAAENDFGLFNDIFGVSQFSGTYTFLDYINNGDTDMPGSTAEEVVASAMPNFWKTNYSGGEFAEGNIRLHVTNDGIIDCLNQVRVTHISWLGPCSALDMGTNDVYAYLYEANVLALRKLMGYHFNIEKITKVSKMEKGTQEQLALTVRNEGVAPFYYDWPLELSFIDSKGKVAYSQVIDVDMPSWMPGRSAVSLKLDVPTELKNGTYTLAIAVLDQDSLKPAMHLAIEKEREDLRYPLYTFTLTGEEKEDVGNSDNNNNSQGGGSSNTGNANSGSTNAGNTSTGSNKAPVAVNPYEDQASLEEQKNDTIVIEDQATPTTSTIKEETKNNKSDKKKKETANSGVKETKKEEVEAETQETMEQEESVVEEVSTVEEAETQVVIQGEYEENTELEEEPVAKESVIEADKDGNTWVYIVLSIVAMIVVGVGVLMGINKKRMDNQDV